jgi:hypothetical protein
VRGEAVVVAEEEVASHVGVDQEWGQSATVEATEVEARVPTTRADRVPCLTAAGTPRVIVLNVRVSGRIVTPSVRKPVVIAGKRILISGRSGVRMPIGTT